MLKGSGTAVAKRPPVCVLRVYKLSSVMSELPWSVPNITRSKLPDNSIAPGCRYQDWNRKEENMAVLAIWKEEPDFPRTPAGCSIPVL